MKPEDVIRILTNGSNKPIDNLNDYTKGKSTGQAEAYAHALKLVKEMLDTEPGIKPKLCGKFIPTQNRYIKLITCASCGREE